MRRPPLIPLQTRATLVTVVFSAIVLVAVVSGWVQLGLLEFIRGLVLGGPVDAPRADAIDARQSLMGIFQLVTRIAGAIVFLNWFHAAHKNLGSRGLERLTYNPASAVWAFFIPILSLFRPYQVMTEVAKGSAYLAGEGRADSWRGAREGPLVALWWGLFLAANLTGFGAARMAGERAALGTLLTAGWIEFASDVLDVPAAIAAVVLVRRISRQQAVAGDHPVTEVFA